MRAILVRLVVLALTLVSPLVQAQTAPAPLDTSALRHAGQPTLFDQWTGQGYLLSSPCGRTGECLGVWGWDSRNQADPTGAAVFVNLAGAVTTLTTLDGSAFSFQSIALADVFNTGVPSTVAFSFQYAAGGSSTQTVTLDDQRGLQTFVFAQQNLRSVSWSTVSGDNGWGQFSAITVASAVPEPGSLALFLAGLGALGVLSRRSRVS